MRSVNKLLSKRSLLGYWIYLYSFILTASSALAQTNEAPQNLPPPFIRQPSATSPVCSQTITPSEIPNGVDECAWESIQMQMKMGRFKAHPNAQGGFSSANLTHGFQIAYHKDGSTRLTPRNWQEVDYHVSMRLVGLGYEDLLKVDNPKAIINTALGQEGGSKVSFVWSEQLTEWWVNDAQQLEQWFYLRTSPGERCAGEPLHLRLALETDMRVQQRGSSLRLQKDGTTLTYDKLKVWDATGKELSTRMHWEDAHLELLITDADAVYPLLIDPSWSQQAYLKASNTGANDQFGWSVAISGETIVVGAWLEDSNATGVDGNQADNSAGDAGAAYVFVRNGSTWSQQAYLKASNTGANDQFGSSVAISGETIVVGAWLEDSNATGVDGSQVNNSAGDAGAAYVFVRSGSTWSQQAYLKASNTGADDQFGRSVAISGETIVVGAWMEDSNATGVDGSLANNSAGDAGAAYVFVRSSGMWSQEAYLKASNTNAGDLFGLPVAISGETIVVGASYEDSNATGVNGNQTNNSFSNAGAAYVFVRSSGMWSQQAYLKASNTGAGDQFGRSVAISGETIVVGAALEESNATGVDGNQADNSAGDAGAAYVFVRSSGMWSQQAYLKASNTGKDDYFGRAVVISGEIIVVGALWEDSNAAGVDGSQVNNSAGDAGAAYVFVRSGSTWSQQAYLKASNTGADDQLGWSVDISGETIVVGARYEDSNATGVNGNQTDNSASYAGAAYVFTIQTILDFGDLSNAYPPAQAEILNGDANNDGIPDAVGAVWAGASIDAEATQNFSVDALGDDLTDLDDEDGLSLPTGPLNRGSSYDFSVNVRGNTGNDKYYGLWFDWNGDGDFTDAGMDAFYTNAVAITGTNVDAIVSVIVPNDATDNYAVRLIVSDVMITSSDYGASFTNGEVEDYITPVALPIELLDFTTTVVENERVLLKWSTASEKDNAYFSVQRSKDGLRWAEIAQVKGAGNSAKVLHYTHWDNVPHEEVNYYRLQQFDYDGKSSLSPVRVAYLENKRVVASLYPNPSSDRVQVQLNSRADDVWHIRVYNSIGQILFVPLQKIADGSYELEVQSLPQGSYFIVIVNKNGSQQQILPFMKQ